MSVVGTTLLALVFGACVAVDGDHDAAVDGEHDAAVGVDHDAAVDSGAAVDSELPRDGEEPAPCGPGRPVLVGEASNARDLGGLPADGVATACGQVYRGGPLSRLGPDGCDELARLGVRTVIDLRQPAERLAVPAAPCVAERANTVLAPMPIPYSLDAPAYLADLDATDALRAAFEALGDPDAYPIYFHCTYGRDRTGVLAAVILDVLGVQRDAVMLDYMISRDNGVGAFPNALSAVIDTLAERGGAEAWLRSIGVVDDQLTTLRARLAPR